MKYIISILLFFSIYSYADNIHDIAAYGTKNDLEKYIKEHPNSINYKNSFSKMPPLITAIKQANEENAIYLVSQGADLSPFQDIPPLIYAIRPLHDETLNTKHFAGLQLYRLIVANVGMNQLVKTLLIKNESDINYEDTKGRTPLFYAISSSLPIIVDTLIKAGSDINHQDHQGNTPLSVAFKQNNDLIIRRLMDTKGLDLSVKNNNGKMLIDLMPKYYKKHFDISAENIKRVDHITLKQITHDASELKDLDGSGFLIQFQQIFNHLLLHYPINQRSLVSYNDIAYHLEQAGYYSQSIYLLERILETSPNRIVAHINLGDAYLGNKNQEKAYQSYQTYIRLMKENGKESRIPKRVLGYVTQYENNR